MRCLPGSCRRLATSRPFSLRRRYIRAWLVFLARRIPPAHRTPAPAARQRPSPARFFSPSLFFSPRAAYNHNVVGPAAGLVLGRRAPALVLGGPHRPAAARERRGPGHALRPRPPLAARAQERARRPARLARGRPGRRRPHAVCHRDAAAHVLGRPALAPAYANAAQAPVVVLLARPQAAVADDVPRDDLLHPAALLPADSGHPVPAAVPNPRYARHRQGRGHPARGRLHHLARAPAGRLGLGAPGHARRHLRRPALPPDLPRRLERPHGVPRRHPAPLTPALANAKPPRIAGKPTPRIIVITVLYHQSVAAPAGISCCVFFCWSHPRCYTAPNPA